MYPEDNRTQRMNQPYGVGADGQGFGSNVPAYEADNGGYGPTERSSYANGPDFNIGKFLGSVIATAVVGAIAGYLVAWIIGLVYEKFGSQWNNGGNDEVMYAIYAVIATLLAGALWYLLYVATPAPASFYTWIVGLLVIASVVVPLLITERIQDGLAAAVVHLVIGIPILVLINQFGTASSRYR